MKGHIERVNINSLIGNTEIYFRIEGWHFFPLVSGQTFRNEIQNKIGDKRSENEMPAESGKKSR